MKENVYWEQTVGQLFAFENYLDMYKEMIFLAKMDQLMNDTVVLDRDLIHRNEILLFFFILPGNLC